MSKVYCQSAVFSMLMIAAAAPLAATSYLPMSDADLIRLAPRIFRAQVLDQSVRVDRVEDRDLPFTIVRLKVLEAFKGPAREDEEEIRLRLPGGAVGDRLWFLPGTPTFQEGDEVVLMVEAFADGSNEFRLTEFGLSRFDLVADPAGRRFAVRPAFSAEADLKLSRVDAPLEALAFGDDAHVPARDAESFLDGLRALSRGEPFGPTVFATPAGKLTRPAPGKLHAEWTNIGGTEPTPEARWFWDTKASPAATVVVSGTQSDLTSDNSCGTDSTCYVKNAVTGWSQISGAVMALQGPSPSGNLRMNLDAPTSPDGGDAWNTPFTCAGGVLGQGGPDPSPRATPFKGDSPFYAIPSGAASFRKSGCSLGYPGRLFKTIVLHEMGHTLGLGHPGVDPDHGESTSIHSATDSVTFETAVMHWSVPDSLPSVPQTDDIQAIQYFYGPATGPVPLADFTFTVPSPSVPNQVRFVATPSNSSTGFSWDFGDPGSGSSNLAVLTQDVYHFFSLPGDYTVTLLEGNLNGTGTVTKTVHVDPTPRVAPIRSAGHAHTLTLPPRPRTP